MEGNSNTHGNQQTLRDAQFRLKECEDLNRENAVTAGLTDSAAVEKAPVLLEQVDDVNET